MEQAHRTVVYISHNPCGLDPSCFHFHAEWLAPQPLDRDDDSDMFSKFRTLRFCDGVEGTNITLKERSAYAQISPNVLVRHLRQLLDDNLIHDGVRIGKCRFSLIHINYHDLNAFCGLHKSLLVTIRTARTTGTAE